MITIEKQRLQELLAEAYEAGWYGSKELKDDAVQALMDKAVEPPKMEKLDWASDKGHSFKVTSNPFMPNDTLRELEQVYRTYSNNSFRNQLQADHTYNQDSYFTDPITSNDPPLDDEFVDIHAQDMPESSAAGGTWNWVVQTNYDDGTIRVSER